MTGGIRKIRNPYVLRTEDTDRGDVTRYPCALLLRIGAYMCNPWAGAQGMAQTRIVHTCGSAIECKWKCSAEASVSTG